ncbi:hypothetical protein [Aequorivita viscosa]|uniref:Fumarate hydratase n=1 Tax=Aequorivita viscosa TaxID=797419 RepID=A0A1M6EIG2_9FLAO|nr:hypothetical protein [Aequorivita viscosa]SDW02274.1 hypothetical protein SAMN05216556_101143 [Aequorivita viscosa]SHI85090.1 hypothetical protein SAMN04487908_10672 [Aequorivita viscosa]
MFSFDQFLGFILVMTVATIGFWLLIFLVGILPYWIGGSIKEIMDEKKAAKQEKK